MLRSIRGLGAEGLDFLRLASVLAVTPIPASLVTAVLEEADKLSHEDAQERASLGFKQVTSASLAEIAGENQDARSVHTLVSRVVRFQENGVPGRTEALRTAAIEAVRSEIAKAAEDPRLHKQIEFHVEHARQLVAIPATVYEASLVAWVAGYDYVRGAYASARTLNERELEFHRNEQGPEHPDTLKSKGNLAVTFRAQGDHAGARRLQERVLEVMTRVLGEEHPDTLKSMGNLADTLWAQGDHAGARRLQERVLEVMTRVLGEEHPDTLRSMWNIGITLLDVGEDEGALRMLRKCLDSRRRVLGDQHPDTIATAEFLTRFRK